MVARQRFPWQNRLHNGNRSAQRVQTLENTYDRATHSWGLLLAVLAFMTLGPIVLHLIADFDKSSTVTVYKDVYIRRMELIDVGAVLPLWLITLTILKSSLIPSSSFGHYPSGLFLLFFTYGHGVHWTANAIHTFYTEYNVGMRLKEKMPEEVHNLVYFLDENLGHWIMFTSLYGFWAMIGLCVKPTHDWCIKTSRACILCSLVGCLGGVAHAVAFVEATQPLFGIALGAMLLTTSLLGHVAHLKLTTQAKAPNNNSTSNTLLPHPFTTFAVCQGLVLAAGIIGYYWLIGAWTQPSEMGGYVCILGQIRVLPPDWMQAIQSLLPLYCVY